MRQSVFIAAVAALVSTATYAAPGPYASAAGQPGSTAIAKGSALITHWATAYSDYQPGADLTTPFMTPANAVGSATTSIVSLGNGGSITLTFGGSIFDGPGADFAVFENGFSDTFLELARVEVSSNGSDFFRFPAISLTPGPVGAFGAVDPTNIDGFAGKYRAGFGTPFDLASLSGAVGLNINDVRHVRIVDVLGNGTEFDDALIPHAIFDPYKTVQSAGFDLESVGVMHFTLAPVPEPEQYALLAAGLALIAGLARRRSNKAGKHA